MDRFTSYQVPKLNLTGCLLVASPGWQDPLFKRSVCLVVHHGQLGAIGVLLNKVLSVEAHALWKQLGAALSASGPTELFLGGPDSGPVVAMHQRRECAEFTPAEGVYFAANVDNLKQLVSDQAGQVRIYLGQSLWSEGQLDQQFSDGCWMPLCLNSRLAFTHPEFMWPTALREVGNRLVEGLAGIETPPANIEDN